MKKRLVSIMLAASLALSLTACGSKNSGSSTSTAGTTDSTLSATEAQTASEAAEPSDEILTVIMAAEPNSLVVDVASVNSSISALTRLIYEPIIKCDEYRSLTMGKNGLCTDWEQIDDTHIRLTIREGVKFHNGEEFTVNDILYQFQEAKRGAQADQYLVFEPDEFVIEDDYHIVLATNRPWAQAIELLSFNSMMVVSKTVLEEAGGADTTKQYLENAGTGKYRFKEWVPGEYILLERNEDYWDKENMGRFGGFKFMFVEDSAARAMTVQSKDADIALGCDIANFKLYDADPSIKAQIQEIGNVNTLILNCGEGPCADEKVREAIYCLIDKAALQSIGGSGFGVLCDTVISPTGAMWDGIDEAKEKTVDVERAKTLLAEAGYPNGLTLKFRASTVTTMISMIQEQLRAGGIELDLVVTEVPVHFQELSKGDYDLYAGTQQNGYYSEAVRAANGVDFSYADIMGGSSCRDEEFAEICRRCLSNTDLEERKAAYAEFQDYYRKHFISVALYTNVSMIVCRPDLEGFDLYGIGVDDMSSLYSVNK